MSIIRLWILACCLLSTTLVAQIELRRTSGETVVGRLDELTDKGQVTFTAAGAESALKLPLRDVVSIRFGNPPVTRHSKNSPLLRFELAGGDLVYGSVVDGNFDEVRVETGFGRFTIPLDALKKVVCLANAEGIDTRADVVGDSGEDVLLVRSKAGVDSVHGSIAKFTQNGVAFEWGDGEETLFTFKKNRVATISLAEPEAVESIKSVHGVVFFRDGSRLTGRVTRARGGPVRFQHGTGSTLELDILSIAEISVRNGSFTHLADLKPVAVKETPYLAGGLTYGVNIDRGLRGGPLSIASRGFPRGLSVHTRCAVTYKLQPGHKFFTTAAGVDGAVAGRRVKGSVSFSVLVDDKVVAGPVVRRAGEEAHWFRGIPVTGAGTLTLVADFADNHHFNGWAVWGSPYLVSGTPD